MNNNEGTNYNAQGKGIPEEAIKAFARSFFKESSAYGFNRLDYLRFVNLLLGLSMSKNQIPGKAESKSEKQTPRLIDLQSLGVFRKLPISGPRLGIRLLHSSSDRELVKDWLSDAKGAHFMLSCTISRDITFDELVASEANVFGLIALPDDTPIGSLAFLDYDPLQRKAELRKLIGVPDMRGKGLAKEATRLWLKYGVEALGLKKIYLNTLNINISNIKLNEELGFEYEGILRNEVFFDGRYHDVLRMGMWTE